MRLPAAFLTATLLLASTALSGCHQLNDERIPHMAVSINLDNQGIWNSFGVHAYGEYNNFILYGSTRLPAGFAYNSTSATGYGGVLLIYGQNAYSGDVGPLAYDLSCPVERMPEVRVYIDHNTLEAVCPDCGSHYDVVEAAGAPLSDPAKAMHYAMTSYRCYATINGGYIITD